MAIHPFFVFRLNPRIQHRRSLGSCSATDNLLLDWSLARFEPWRQVQQSDRNLLLRLRTKHPRISITPTDQLAFEGSQRRPEWQTGRSSLLYDRSSCEHQYSRVQTQPVYCCPRPSQTWRLLIMSRRYAVYFSPTSLPLS